MKDIRQIKLIAGSLQKQKDKYVFELAKVNKNIENKILLVNKMIAYQKDYFNVENLKLSRTIPGLNNNIDRFVNKIESVIEQTRQEISQLKRIRESLLGTIQQFDKKLDLMDIFEDKSKKALKMKDDRNEQKLADDIVATIELRREDD